jgi:hypothetical protein
MAGAGPGVLRPAPAGIACTAAATAAPPSPVAYRSGLHCHQPTKDYLARRTAEGRAKKQILRCLQRSIAGEISPRLPGPTSPGGRQRCEDRLGAAI